MYLCGRGSDGLSALGGIWEDGNGGIGVVRSRLLVDCEVAQDHGSMRSSKNITLFQMYACIPYLVKNILFLHVFGDIAGQ